MTEALDYPLEDCLEVINVTQFLDTSIIITTEGSFHDDCSIFIGLQEYNNEIFNKGRMRLSYATTMSLSGDIISFHLDRKPF
jgi:hypothetical protein